LEYRAVSVLDEEFFKGHVQKIQRLAEAADPLIKRRLLQLANKYEQQASEPPRLPADFRGLEVKLTPER
jgi:hypothetical protein